MRREKVWKACEIENTAVIIFGKYNLPEKSET
jgi:hypothetical protein